MVKNTQYYEYLFVENQFPERKAVRVFWKLEARAALFTERPVNSFRNNSGSAKRSSSSLFTDKNTSNEDLEKLVEEQKNFKFSPESTNGDLNWVHVALSNLKRNLLGIYNMVS